MAGAGLTRRGMLAATGAVGIGLLVGCGGSGGQAPPLSGSTLLFKRSVRSKRASRAAKLHAANRVYATALAAASDPAHPGDNADVVRIDTTRETWRMYFGSGAQVYDYRWT